MFKNGGFKILLSSIKKTARMRRTICAMGAQPAPDAQTAAKEIRSLSLRPLF